MRRKVELFLALSSRPLLANVKPIELMVACCACRLIHILVNSSIRLRSILNAYILNFNCHGQF